jgi:hypothetical protein
VKRALEVLAKLGSPIAAVDAGQIAELSRQSDSVAVEAAEKILDRYTLATLSIASGGTSRVAPAGARKVLVEQGWTMFLVRVANSSGGSDPFLLSAGFATPGQMGLGLGGMAQRAYLMDTLNKAPLIEKMWLLAEMYETTPAVRYGVEFPTVALTGAPVEYHVVQLFSRDSGRRSAALTLTNEWARRKSGRREKEGP